MAEDAAAVGDGEGAVPFARALMRRGLRRPVRQVALPGVGGGLVGAADALAREAGWAGVPVLSGLPQVVLCWGGGGSGKTVLGRLLSTLWSDAGVLAATSFVAADPGARLLPQFIPNVEQPRGSEPWAIGQFVEDYLDWWGDAEGDRPRFGFADLGGGNAAAEAAVRGRPALWRRVAESGAEVVQACCLTPRVADLALPVGLEAAGWSPRATVFVLNLAKAERGLASFDELRGQDGYRAMLARGAVEVALPRLGERVAQAVEGSASPFHLAREGRVPKGSDAPPLDEADATAVAGWLAACRTALAPLFEKGWLVP